MKKRISHIPTTVVVIFAAATLLLDTVMGFVLSSRAKASMREAINARMLDIANTAAAMVDGDDLKNLTVGEEDTPAYQKMYATMEMFRDNIDLEYIYTIRSMGSNSFIFLVDTAEENPAEFGELVVVTDAIKEASLGKPTVDRESYEDRWGRFYSAYSPVRDSGGRIVGLVGVDFKADWYESQIGQYANKSLLFCCISSAGGLVLMCTIVVKRRALVRALGGISDELDELERKRGAAEGAQTDAPRQSREEVGAAEKLCERAHALREGRPRTGA